MHRETETFNNIGADCPTEKQSHSITLGRTALTPRNRYISRRDVVTTTSRRSVYCKCTYTGIEARLTCVYDLRKSVLLLYNTVREISEVRNDKITEYRYNLADRSDAWSLYNLITCLLTIYDDVSSSLMNK